MTGVRHMAQALTGPGFAAGGRRISMQQEIRGWHQEPENMVADQASFWG